MKTYAIIPARAGSKGVPKKNIKDLSGHPLIAYSIAAGLLCKDIERVIVSTDSEEIADIAKKYGAEVPFMRPAQFAVDTSPNIEFILHALDWFKDNEGVEPDILIQLLPTTPLRDPQLISNSIRVMVNSFDRVSSLRSVQELPEPPQKMMAIKDGLLEGFFPDDSRAEYYNLPRQTFPTAYHPNGYVEIIKKDFVRSGKGLFGPRVMGFITPVIVEIDRIEEFQYLEYLTKKERHPLHDYLETNHPRS